MQINFDTNKTKAIKSEKIGENVYYLTYDSSKEADRALDKYSKDENIIYCEKDTAIQTSEVDDTPSIQEAIINQHKNSEQEIFITILMLMKMKIKLIEVKQQLLSLIQVQMEHIKMHIMHLMEVQM